MKNLKFGIKSGKAKCHQMHIGKNDDACPTLKAHHVNIEKVNEDTYVGDIISNDGKLNKNINARISKAKGKAIDILNILSEVSLGYHYFDMAMVFRNSMFINSVMTNSEIWYLIQDQLKGLMVEDKSLLKKILKVPVSTTNCLVYLETGQIPIEDLIKARSCYPPVPATAGPSSVPAGNAQRSSLGFQPEGQLLDLLPRSYNGDERVEPTRWKGYV